MNAPLLFKCQLLEEVLGFQTFGFESLEIFSNLIVLINDVFQQALELFSLFQSRIINIFL